MHSGQSCPDPHSKPHLLSKSGHGTLLGPALHLRSNQPNEAARLPHHD